MEGMFNGAENLDQYLAHWDVSNVTNMNYMFKGAKKFNETLESESGDDSWDVSNVLYAEEMFYGAEIFNQDLTGWSLNTSLSAPNMFVNSGMSASNYPNCPHDSCDWD